jgi:hypothetical protein
MPLRIWSKKQKKKISKQNLQVVHVEVVAVVEDPDAVEDARRGPVVKVDPTPVELVAEHTVKKSSFSILVCLIVFKEPTLYALMKANT